MTRLAPLVLLACAGGLLAACSRDDDKTATEQFTADYQSISHNWQERYVAPLLEATLQTTTDCAQVEPGDTEQHQCADFVQVLEEISPVLDETISELQRLGSAPSPLGSPESFIERLQLMLTTNEALIQGWENQDPEEWAHGWELYAEARDIDNLLGTPPP